MSNNAHISNAAARAQLDAALAKIPSFGAINIYSGSQPATPDTALSGQTLLVTLNFNNQGPAFAPSGGVVGTSAVATANPILSGTAVATGTAAWFRVFDVPAPQPAYGVPPAVVSGKAILDGTVGTASADMILSSSTTITAGDVISISSWTVTLNQ